MRMLAAATLLAFALPVTAQEIDYDFVEAGLYYDEIDTGDFDVDGDGFRIAGSIALSPRWHAFTSYENLDFDFGVDVDTFEIGGGYHVPLVPDLDLVVELSYVTSDGGSGPIDFDDSGLAASLGVRTMLLPALEVAGFVDYVDLDDIRDDTMLRGETWYEWTPSIAFGASLEIGSDEVAFGFGARWYYQ
jgi:hypothetical protein